MTDTPTTAAHVLASELRKLGALLAGHADPAIADDAAPSVLVAAGVIEALADQLLWRAGLDDELAVLLCRIHTWAQCDLEANGPGPCGGYVARAAASTRALDLGLRALAAIEELSRAVARS